MNNKLNIGIMGASRIVEPFLNGISTLTNAKATAIYNRNVEKGQAFASKHNLTFYANANDMFANVDAVYVASANHMHFTHAKEALLASKHVLLEKPFTSTVAEAEELFTIARQKNVCLMEAMKNTLMPNMQVLINNLPRLGKIQSFFGNYCQYSSRYPAFLQGDISPTFLSEAGGGSLVDLGVYPLSVLVHLFGKPTSIQASATLLSTGVDISTVLILSYPTMQAIIRSSKNTASAIASEVLGEDGSLTLSSINEMTNLAFHPRTAPSTSEALGQELTAEEMKNAMCYEIEEFAKTILAGKLESSINTHERSKIVMGILEEARRQIGVVFG